MQSIGPKQYELYQERAQLTQEIQALEAEVNELKAERAEIDRKLSRANLGKTCTRLLPNGNILHVNKVVTNAVIGTPEMVGTVIRRGSSYLRFREVEPEPPQED